MENTMDATLDHARHLSQYLSHCSSSYIIQIALKELGVPSSRAGFHLAKHVIRLMCENPVDTLTNGVYLKAAVLYNFPADNQQVEQAIRTAIRAAWTDRDAEIWNYYFPKGIPGRCKCPSNKEFIMAIVDFVVLWKGFCEEARNGQAR